MDKPMKYKIRPGTVDRGRDYEAKITAALCLKCINQETEDLWIAVNVDECEAFDDIVLYRKSKKDDGITYLIQLKHQDKQTPIIEEQFLAAKGDFSLKKYSESLRKLYKNIRNKSSSIANHLRQMSSKNKNAFIIFTNKGVNDCKFLLKTDDTTDVDIVNIDGGTVHKFDYAAFELDNEEDTIQQFHEKFYLFTNQPKVDNLDNIIENTISDIIQSYKLQKTKLSMVAKNFIEIISEWSKGNLGGHYVITKNELLKILAELLLKSYHFSFEKPGSNNHTFDETIWNDLISDKEVTIIEHTTNVEKFLNQWLHVSVHKHTNILEKHNTVRRLLMRPTHKLDLASFDDSYELLWKTCKIPLILQCYDKTTAEDILHILEVFQGIFKVIILNKADQFKNVGTPNAYFTDLTNLNQHLQEQILNCSVKLQGRSSIQLKEIVDEISFRLITVKDIIDILLDDFNVGNTFESLPNIFIEPSLSTVLLQFSALKEVFEDVFIIKCNSKQDFDECLNKHRLSINASKICVCEEVDKTINPHEQNIILIFNENIRQQVQFSTTAVIHHLALLNEDSLEWIYSNGSIKQIRSFQRKTESTKINTTDEIIKKISDTKTSNSHIISAIPGMGKTVFIDYIALNAPTDVWVLKINLPEHRDYYEEEQFETSSSQASQILEHFAYNCNDLSRRVYQKYLKLKKVLVLFDSFDEIPFDCHPQVIQMIHCLHESQYPIFVATRPITATLLEDALDSLAFTIHPFLREDQELFLTKFFTSALENSSKNCDNIKLYVKKLLNAAKNNLNDCDNELTGVVLQTKLLAEVYITDCKTFIQTDTFVNEHFDLLYLLETFIQQKTKIACKKFKYFSKNKYKNQCSLYALQLLFTKNDLKELSIDEELAILTKDLPEMQLGGVVVPQNKSDVTFIHRTFTEYTAAVWLAENLDSKYKVLIKKTLHPNYRVLRNIFDRILAKESKCPLHTAVINRQLEEIEAIIKSDKDALKKVDKGNRTFLHLMAAWGIHHPSNFLSNNYLQNTNNIITKLIETTPTEILNASLGNIVSVINLPDNIKHELIKGLDKISVKNMFNQVSVNCVNKEFTHYQNGIIWYKVIYKYKDNLHDLLNKTAIERDTEVIYNDKFISSFISKNKASILNYINYNLDDSMKKLKTKRFSNKIICEIMAYIFNKVSDFSKELKEITNDTSSNSSEDEYVIQFVNNIKVKLIEKLDSPALKNAFNILFNNVLDALLKFSREFNLVLKYIQIIKADVIKFLNDDVTSKTETVCYTTIDNLAALFTGASSDYFISIKDILKNEFEENSPIELIKLILDNFSDLLFDDFNDGTEIFNNFYRIKNKLLQELENDALSHLIKTIPKDDLHTCSQSTDTIFNYTPLDYAIATGSLSIADSICSQLSIKRFTINDFDTESIFRYCSEFEYGSLAAAITKNIIDVNITNALNKRINNVGNSEQFKLLINKMNDYQQDDALHLAASNFVKQVNINEQDRLGMTALHWATIKGYKEIVSLLLSKGAEVDIQDNKGITPLHHAIFSVTTNKTEIIALLLDNDADPNFNDSYGNSALHNAIFYNQIDAIKLLLEYKANVNFRDFLDKTPLHWAARYGNTEIIELLMLNKADPTIKDKYLKRNALEYAVENGHSQIVDLLLQHLENNTSLINTTLIEAAKHGQTDIVRLCLIKGIAAEARDDENKTALIWASQNNNVESFTTLLDRGADISARDNQNMTVLHWAAYNGSEDMVKLLLSKKVEVEAKDMQGRTALILAATSDYIDTVTELLNSGADIHSKNNRGMTALHTTACQNYTTTAAELVANGANLETKDKLQMTPLQWAAYYGHSEMIHFLISKGADTEAKDEKYGRTALIIASTYGNTKAVVTLLKNRAYLQAVNNQNMTALHVAALGGHSETASVLLAEGADIEAIDKYHRTPLITAAKNSLINTMFTLILNGANIHAKDMQNVTALHLAACRGYTQIASVLLNAGADVTSKDCRCMTPLHWSAYKGNTALTTLLLNFGENIEEKDSYSRTALIMATMNDHISTVISLLFQKADVKAKTNRNMTALHLASYKGHTDIARLLINKNADLEALNKRYRTPLILASTKGHNDAADLLLSKGCNVQAKDHQQMTALHWASFKGHTNVVKLLLDKGAKLEARNKHGRTSLILAAATGHADTVSLLVHYGANVEVTDKNNKTALAWAQFRGHVNMAEFLNKRPNLPISEMKYGNERIKLLSGVTYLDIQLHLATFQGNVNHARWLLDSGASLEAKLKMSEPTFGASSSSKPVPSMTLLQIASMRGHIDIVRLFLDRGADLESTDENGATALISASVAGKIDIVRFLLDRGADLESTEKNGGTALISASVTGQIDIVRLLLDRGADLESTDKNGRTALILTASLGQVDSMILLISRGANIEAKCKKTMTALHMAALVGKTNVARLLLDNGADLEAKSEVVRIDSFSKILDDFNLSNNTLQSVTPLQVASSAGHTDIVRLFLDRGADLESTDKHGRTALMFAACASQIAVTDLLITRGANRHAADNENKTALQWAKQKNHTNMIAFLKNKYKNRK